MFRLKNMIEREKEKISIERLMNYVGERLFCQSII